MLSPPPPSSLVSWDGMCRKVREPFIAALRGGPALPRSSPNLREQPQDLSSQDTLPGILQASGEQLPRGGTAAGALFSTGDDVVPPSPTTLVADSTFPVQWGYSSVPSWGYCEVQIKSLPIMTGRAVR